MYRINPFTYVVEGFLATALAGAPVTCTSNELVRFESRDGQTCGDYVEAYIAQNGGYLVDNSTTSCSYCGTASTDAFLDEKNMDFDNRWRNLGIMWGFCFFNIAVTVGLYWLMRVPKRSKMT